MRKGANIKILSNMLIHSYQKNSPNGVDLKIK